MDGLIYPDFTRPLSGSPPVFRFERHEIGDRFVVSGYEVHAIAARHSVPAVGYVVRSASGACFAYSGDTGGGLLDLFEHEWRPSVVFVEMTLPNRLAERAATTGHLTPRLLEAEIRGARSRGSTIPSLAAVHVGFSHREVIAGELADVSAATGVQITRGLEDMVFDFSPASRAPAR
jgi:hypothetical protein